MRPSKDLLKAVHAERIVFSEFWPEIADDKWREEAKVKHPELHFSPPDYYDDAWSCKLEDTNESLER